MLLAHTMILIGELDFAQSPRIIIQIDSAPIYSAIAEDFSLDQSPGIVIDIIFR